uniref:C-type lectin domain-containing protein n=1 Tax=Sinocyclocheilus grahami TaxID=75366 RepID=A0A672LRB8_SINGR
MGSITHLGVVFLNYNTDLDQDGTFRWVDKTAVEVVFLLWFTECFSADSHCDEGYLLFGEHCYHFETETVKNWQDAENYCVAQNGHLVSIHNQEAVSFIQVSLWMGAHDSITEGGYHWSDGTPVSHTNWGHGEPNNHNGRENCVEMVTTENGTSWWNDLNCDAHQDWICMIAKGKKPIIPPEPPSPVPGNNGINYYQ